MITIYFPSQIMLNLFLHERSLFLKSSNDLAKESSNLLVTKMPRRKPQLRRGDKMSEMTGSPTLAKHCSFVKPGQLV